MRFTLMQMMQVTERMARAEAERDRLVAALAEARAENERLQKIAEPECWCEHVDIGVGMQKVADNPECPACWPPERHEYEHRKHVEAERDEARAALVEAHRTLADVEAERDELRIENAAHIERTIFQRDELSRLASALAEARAENERLREHLRGEEACRYEWHVEDKRENERLATALAEAHRTLADREKAIEWTYRFAGGDGDRHGPNLASNVRDRLRRIVGEIRSGAESAGEQRG